MNIIKSVIAATALAAASLAASAGTISFSDATHGTFTGSASDSFSFNLLADAGFDGGVTSVLIGSFGFDITSVFLDSTPYVPTLASTPPFTFDGWSLSTSLLPGLHTISVTGTGTGSYLGSLVLSPVPEPATLALALAGLGLIGLARRKVI